MASAYHIGVVPYLAKPGPSWSLDLAKPTPAGGILVANDTMGDPFVARSGDYRGRCGRRASRCVIPS